MLLIKRRFINLFLSPLIKPEKLLTIEAQNHIISDENGVKLPLAQGKYVKVTVQDKGTGIPEENLPRIFDPYFTTKEMGTQKGMGLGLAIIRSIIHKHKGFIFAESEPGAGSAFHIYLPAHENDKLNADFKIGADVPDSDPVLSEHNYEKRDLSVKKILVMDDEEMIRDLVCHILKKLGYEPGCAKDGIEAVFMYKKALASGKSYDAVILDLTIQGGGMGGCETIKKLAEINPAIKSIVSSGYSNEPIMSEYKNYGFKGALAKPYTSKELKEELQKLLDS
ncbi:ATP-binding protein [Desulfobacterales bacterium HSG17]|nr:ATP-binding protein [Desulfobacterales bacterium HSG17]